MKKILLPLGNLRILLVGYYGEGNLGDELILMGLLRGIKDKFRNKKFTLAILTGNPRQTRDFIEDEKNKEEINYKFVHRKSIVKIIKALAESDIVVVGGGGLFQDFTSSRSLYYYLLIILISKILGKKVSVCSVGIDRLKKFNSFLTRSILKMADTISVRDKESLDFFSSPKMSSLSVKQFADLALALDIAPYELKKSDAHASGEKNQLKFIFVPRRFGRTTEIHFWARLADMCVRRYSGACVALAAFHKKEDADYIRRIAALCEVRPAFLSWENPRDMIREFSSATLVVSARLHGIILAASLNIPLVGVSADRKSDLFLKEIEQKNIYRVDGFDKTGDEMAFALISDTLRWSDDFRQKLSKNVGRLKRLSLAAADWAFSFF